MSNANGRDPVNPLALVELTPELSAERRRACRKVVSAQSAKAAGFDEADIDRLADPDVTTCTRIELDWQRIGRADRDLLLDALGLIDDGRRPGYCRCGKELSLNDASGMSSGHGGLCGSCTRAARR